MSLKDQAEKEKAMEKGIAAGKASAESGVGARLANPPENVYPKVRPDKTLG